MPKFLEKALKKAAAKQGLTGEDADRYTYGALNNMGALRGNQETAKGRAIGKEARGEDLAGGSRQDPAEGGNVKHKLDSMEIRVAKNGGHLIKHHFKPQPASKAGRNGGMFMDVPPAEEHTFGATEGSQALAHIASALGLKGAPKDTEEED